MGIQAEEALPAEGAAGDDPASAPLHAGDVLDGRYRLERKLGEGGMGTVWVAHQIALEREVALKLLNAAFAETLRTRLRHEALTLAAVHHPAVVQVYDYGETATGVPFVVMELVRGESLSHALARVGSMPAEEAVRLVLPLLEGLSAVHAAGVVHRDIKPDNVLLVRGANGRSPKLVDFGIATFGHGKDLLDDRVVGTPSYMSPEQARGLATDERTDVWAVATMLYELMAGAPPFVHSDVREVLRAVVAAPPPYPRAARGFDGRLWSILMSALRKAPADRTPSAAAMRRALEQWLDGASSSVAPSVTLPAPVVAPLAPTLLAGAPSTSPPPASTAETPKTPLAAAPGGSVPSASPVPLMDALIRTKLGG